MFTQNIITFAIGFFAVALCATSCQTTPNHANKPETSDSLQKTSIKSTLDTAKRLSEIEDSIQAYSKNFLYQKRDLPYSTYYHKNWWGRYLIADKALTCGLDSAGNIFLFSMYEGSSAIQHHSVSILSGNVKITSRIADNPTLFPVLLNVRATQWEVNSYSNEDSLLRFIADNSNQKIYFEFNGTTKKVKQELIGKHKEGIRDSYYLARLLREKKALK